VLLKFVDICVICEEKKIRATLFEEISE